MGFIEHGSLGVCIRILPLLDLISVILDIPFFYITPQLKKYLKVPLPSMPQFWRFDNVNLQTPKSVLGIIFLASLTVCIFVVRKPSSHDTSP